MELSEKDLSEAEYKEYVRGNDEILIFLEAEKNLPRLKKPKKS